MRVFPNRRSSTLTLKKMYLFFFFFSWLDRFEVYLQSKDQAKKRDIEPSTQSSTDLNDIFHESNPDNNNQESCDTPLRIKVRRCNSFSWAEWRLYFGPTTWHTCTCFSEDEWRMCRKDGNCIFYCCVIVRRWFLIRQAWAQVRTCHTNTAKWSPTRLSLTGNGRCWSDVCRVKIRRMPSLFRHQWRQTTSTCVFLWNRITSK